MKCDFCQNWNISQRSADKFANENSPEEIVSSAMSYDDNIGIAFTYNEPVIWFEFIKDIAIMIKEKGLHTVLVSNGYVNRSPLSEIIGFTDAFNIDLKAFNGEFYRRLTGAEIEPVKETLKQIVKAGRHLEITTLIIPGKNDDLREMDLETKWIADELGTETPFHLSRYFPMYKRDDTATPQSTLDRLYETASANLRNVYIGNAQTASGQDTRCKCGAVVTMRSGYQTRFINLDNNGKCRLCGETVYRHFTSRQDRKSVV